MINRSVIRVSWCFLVLLVAAPLAAATFSSTTSGNWSSASTWGGAGVPGAGDTATVNGGHVVTLDVSVTVANLTLNGGQINGSQSLAVTTLFSWNSGTLSGASSASVAAATIGGGCTLDTRSLSNSGSFVFTSGNYMYMQNNAAFSNSGTVDFQGDGGGIFQSGALGTMSITNSGTIKKSGTSGQTTIQIPVNAQSGSQVVAQAGQLNVGPVSGSGGTWSASSGAILEFNTSDTRTFDAASTVSGAGTIYWAAGTNTINGTYSVTGTTKNNGTTTVASVTSSGDVTVTGGTLTLNSASTLSINALNMQGGILAGTAPIALAGTSQTWTGGTIAGSGLLTIPNTTTVTLNGYVYFDTRAISNAGTLNYTSSYYSYFYNSATLANSGTVDFQGDGGFYIGSGSPSVTNSGTIKKSAGTGASGLQVALVANSGSQYLAQSGTFYMGQVTSTGATFSVSGGATLSAVYSNTRTFDSASAINGAGTVDWAAGTNTVNAAYNVTGATKNNSTTSIGTNITALGDVTCSSGALTITNSSAPTIGNITASGGTLTLNIPTALSIAQLNMTGGILAGTASISLTGTTQTWTGGTIGGSGTLTIPITTTVTFNGYVYFDTRAVTNNGTLNYTSNYYSYFYNSATLTNNGTVDFQGDGGFYLGSGSPSVTNNGTIKKSAGTGQGGIQISLVAASGSQLLVQSGTLALGNVTSTSAALNVSSGATAFFTYTTTSSFDAASSISGAGNVWFNAGTNTVGAAYSVTGTTKSGGGTTTIGNITAISNIVVSGGTLTLNSAGALSVTTLAMQGGILNGTAPITLTGAAQTWSGGTIAGSGLLTIPNTTTVTFNGYVYYDTRAITNGGTLNYTSNYYSYFYNGATLTNNGTVDFQGDGGFFIANGSDSVVNNGTIKKSAGTGQGSIQVPLTANSGSQILVQSGTLALGNVTSSGAALNVSSGATAFFTYTTTSSFDSASSISGAGTVWWNAGTNAVSAAYSVTGTTKSGGGATTIDNITAISNIVVSGGTLTLNSAGALSVATLTMQGGILNGTAPISLTGAAQSWSGGTIAGSGLLTIPNGTTVTITGYISYDTRPISNAGIINYTSSYYSYFYNGAVLTNSGTIDFQGDGGLYIGAGSGNAVTNGGTIKKSAGTGQGAIQVAIAANSGSQILVQSGTLALGNVTSTSATLNVSSGATAYFLYTTTSSFDSGSTISGAGSVYWGAGTNTVNAGYNVTGTTKNGATATTIGNITSVGDLVVLGGTLTLNSAGAISVPTLSMQGGILNGTAPINITGSAMTWSGGTIGGTGTLTIPNTTTITVAGYPIFDTRPVTSAATINITSTYYISMQNNAVLTTSGMINMQSDGSVFLSSAVGTTAVVNSGTIKKSGGTGASYFNVPLTQQSGAQFLVQSGTVYFGNMASSGGTLNISSGAVAYLNYTTTGTFDSASIISGAGTFEVAAGTTTFSGTITTALTMVGGTFTVNSASAQTIPTLTMQGGTLNGSANVNLTGASMTWSGGTIGGSGTLTIPNGTTITVAGYPYFDARTVTNAGTINLTSTYYIYMTNGAVLNNGGTIDFQGDSSLLLYTAPATVNNSGTIKKSSGTGSTSFTVPLNALSGSQFQVQSSGTVYLGGALTSTGGTFTVASGAVLNAYYGDTRTFDASSSISGAGTFMVQGGTNTFSGTLSAAVNVTGGTLTINSAGAQSIPTLTLGGGILNGTANISLTGSSMTWTGGTLGGSGTFTIPAAATITISGYPFIDARPVTNNGTISITSTYYVYMENGAVLTNNGNVGFVNDGNILYYTGAACSIVNNGTLGKSGGTGTSSVSVAVNNAAGGTIKSTSGILSFTNGLTQSGTLLFPISGATAFGKVNVSGAFALGGTLTATTISYTPTNGTSFQILTYGSHSGAFASKNLDYSAGSFTESYTTTDLTLTAGPPTITVTSVTPSRGGIAGGTSVTVAGTNFANGATVTFGGTAAGSVTFNNSTSLTATTPAHVVGPVDVTVTNPNTQAATLQNGFTYTGLVSHYSFDILGKDIVSGNDATSIVNVSQGSGKSGFGGTFTSGYMDLPTPTSFNLRSGDFTIEAFVNSTSTSNANWLTKAAAGPTHYYGLGTAASTKALFSFDGGSGGSVTSTSNIFDGTWHHVAGIKRGASIEIWVDGKLEASGSVTGTADGGAFAIGRNGACCESFNGSIDEAKIYNYALTSSEVITDALATDLTIVKSAPPSATVGFGLTYSITVTNNGPISATNVVVSDTLPAGTTFTSATTSQGSCSGTSTVTCSLGTIANGANATISITVNTTTSGTITNTATVSASEHDPVPSDNSSSASTAVSALTCNAPTITASGSTTFCQGGSVQLNANASPTPTAYQWYLNNVAINSATSSSYVAAVGGNYSVRVVYPSTCSATSNQTAVTVNPPPSAVISAPSTACPNANVSASAPASAGATYNWTVTNANISNGQGTDVINFTPNGGGNVALQVDITDANGCSATGTATVTIGTLTATITPSGPTTFCTGGSVTLTASPSGGSYLWSTGATTQSITVGSSGNYSVTVTNGAGCSGSSAPVAVTVTPPPSPSISASGPTTFCAPGSVTLTASPNGGSYLWSNGATTQSITVFGSGTFSVTVTLNGCSATSGGTTVTVNPAPIVSISGPSAFCAGSSVTLDAGPGFASYLWSNGATTQTITDSPAATTTYSVTVTNNAGCSGTASKTVTQNGSPTPAITAAAAVCANSAGNAASVSTVSGATYAWTVTNGSITSGQGTNAITYSAGASGNVTIAISVTGGSCSGSSSKSIPIQAPPVVTITGPTTTCPNASFTLDAGAGFATYAWSNGATTRTITVTETATTTYSVTVTTGAGCSAAASQTVTIASGGSVTIAAPSSAVANSAGNHASVSSGPAGTTYSWSITNGGITAGQGTPSITFTAGPSGTLTLNISVNNAGCLSTGSANVTLTSLADLAVSIAAPSSVNTGAPMSYVISVSNLGPTTAQNVNVSDVLPSGVTFGSVSGTGWSCSPSGNVVNCNAASVAVGNATPITINATAPSTGGSITDTATVSSSTPDSKSSNNSVSVTTNVVAPSPTCPSTPPSLLGPANGATGVTNPVAFSWTAVPTAIAYDLFVNGSVAASTTSTSASVGLPAGSATWNVVARFASCQPLFSETRTFTVAASANCAHAAPQLLGAPPFQWTAVAEAIGYRVWVSIDGGAFQDVGTTGGALTLNVPLTGTNIAWFVEALFNGCPSTKSDTATFTIPKPDPCASHSAAMLAAPANNSTSSASAVTFQWNAATGASGYRLFASTDGAPFTNLGTTTDTTLAATLTAGAIEWYVQTLFDGCPAQDSAHFTFTIPKAQNCPQSGAVPQSPINVTLTQSPVTFTWSAAPNAIGYDLWLSLDHAAPALLGSTTSTTFTHDAAAGALEWYVVTHFNGCPSVESAHVSFTRTTPPNCTTTAAILTVPGDSTGVAAPVDFAWSAVPGVSQYQLFAARNGGAPSLLGSTAQLHLDAQPLQAGNWQWFVVSTFSNGCSSTQSAPGAFTVAPALPPCAPPPTPTVRGDSSASSNIAYSIRWNSVGNAGFYEIQQSTTPDFSTADTDAVFGTEKSYKHINNTTAPIFFYYRVRAVGSCDATVKSLYSPVIAVGVLPSQNTNAAAPADDPQPVTYTLNIPAQPNTAFIATANQPWITIVPSSGTTTSDTLTLTVTADTSALPVGTSTAAISVVFGAAGKLGTNATSSSTSVNVNLVQPVTPGSKNTPPPDSLIIPAIAHAGGINSNFQSDVRVTNTAPQTAKYQLIFTPDGGAAKTTTVSIDPGKTLALDDILATWFGGGTSAIGTLEIRPSSTTTSSSSPTATPSITTFAASRTYNVTANGTFGQYIPAIPFSQFISKTGLISLQQIASSAAFRTNLGLLEGSGDPATALISVFGNDGVKLAEFTQNLAGGQHIQLNGVLAAQGLTNLADGRIEVRLTSNGGKVTAYASVLDNATNDPLLVAPVSITTVGAPKYVLPGIADLNNGIANWRSDVRIYNPTSSAVNATVTFYPLGGGDPTSKTISIAPNEVKQLDSALNTLFGIANAGGALHITTENNAALVATARTYNQTSNGTFGQFIPAVTPNDAVGKGGRALQILQVEESDRFRSNIGVTEVTGKPAKVEITAIPPDSKFAVTGTFDFGPNEYRQYSSLLKSLGLDTAYNTRVTVRVVDGDGKVSAYASVVDQKTQDPNYVNAQ